MTLLFLFLLIDHVVHLQKTEKVTTPPPVVKPLDPFAASTQYSTALQTELAKYNLEQYTAVLIAIMQQESHGKGGDPMQSSESAGLPPNTINNPAESIKQGVKHFNKVVNYGTKKNVDFETIIQSYNMGMGYINYVADSGNQHSEELAKQFSKIQVQKNPAVYNCGGDKSNFRYPYCYGDFSYTTKVTKNIEMLSDSMPALVSALPADIF
ncbi:hypothetical protein D0469_14475 [Peribacillus saganii]|uniref:CwlT-like lysozyme domain-containing protein n=2 Tax=Peribacillus saganii TaxID=2303992 RepID=A0A372LL65_9BACI|nr:hypothetical protein D0469_14475 [Peribacillus saganii]